jgi:hypothetical protein
MKRKRVRRRNRSHEVASLPLRPRARRIFISHSWRLSSYSYQEISNKLTLEGAAIYNHSIPKYKARLIQPTESIRTLFRKQLLWCSKVFVLAHPELSPAGYVAMELEVAAELGKEIIAIQSNRHASIPQFIRRYANCVISDRQSDLLLSLK